MTMTLIIKRDQAAGDTRQCMTYIATLKSGAQINVRAVSDQQALDIVKRADELKRKTAGLFCIDTCTNLMADGKVCA